MTRLLLVPLLAILVATPACTKKPNTPPAPKVAGAVPCDVPAAAAAG